MLELEGLTKKFGDLVANDRVDLSIGAGEIHALLGENGAGKSTLVKMLYGSLKPDGGIIKWKGNAVSIANPSKARSLGIGMVFQHFSLFEALSVTDNIVLALGRDSRHSDIAGRAQILSVEYGLPLNPASMIGDLSVGERQRVEIVRCLLQEPDLIVLDEPTSVLTPQEAENLFETLLRLKGEGKSILYISHRLEEVKQICDKATILRHGKVVAHCDPKQETAASLAAMMVGNDIRQVKRSEVEARSGEVVLELKTVSLAAATPFATPLTNISMTAEAGKVIGIAGVAGNGQSELFDVLSGETVLRDNSAISICGVDCGSHGINARRRLGAGFVPEERLGHGAVPDFSLSRNLLLARHASDRIAYARNGILRNGALARGTKRICEAMDVRKSGNDPVASSLSGGNLQKFIMGRELDRQPRLLLVNQPTWGVDAGAAANIRQALIDMARAGSAVLVISQDLDEIFEISDEIAVMSEGELTEPVPTARMTREQVGLRMAGINTNVKGHENGAAREIGT